MTDTPRSGRRHPSLWSRVRHRLSLHRQAVEAAFDAFAWLVGITAAVFLRFEFAAPGEWSEWGNFDLGRLARAALLAILLQLAIGSAIGLYRGRWRYGSFDEVSNLATVVASTSAVLAVVNALVFDRLVPTSATIVGGTIAFVLMSVCRYLWRLNLERRLRPSAENTERVVVFGAGEGGLQVITAMMRNPESPYLPVALLDDHPLKQKLEIMGIRVEGTREELGATADRHEAHVVVIAIPSADSELLRDISERALEAELEVKVLPGLDELLDGSVGVGDIRPISETDLLGRHEIDTDVSSISGYLTGRTVLVTGAGGSIGSELCYQISQFAPRELVMLDRDESALHGIQLRIDGRAMLDSRNLVVADIRDKAALREVMVEHRPEVVFHTAALKHLPLLEMHPLEAVKTNIVGTTNLLELATELGVQRFVNISTDKAADPTSVLGYTKRIAERITAKAAGQTGGTFLSVRFGNVLGSRGSVLTAFHRQIQAGGPVTVTDPEVTRYFMTVEEAVQLVIQAGAVGRDGEALVLDMGEPVRIDDVARRLASQAERPIEILYTGLRPGEKLHEALFGADEVDERPVHPLISHVRVPPISAADVTRALAAASGAEALVDSLRRLAVPGAPNLGAPRT